MRELRLIALEGLPEITAGADLAALLLDALARHACVLTDGDILVVAQKIISKAEARRVLLKDVIPSARARELAATTLKDPRLVECMLREAVEVLRVRLADLAG